MANSFRPSLEKNSVDSLEKGNEYSSWSNFNALELRQVSRAFQGQKLSSRLGTYTLHVPILSWTMVNMCYTLVGISLTFVSKIELERVQQ